MGRKLGAVPHFWGQELCPHLTESRLCRGLDLCQVAPNPFSRLATIDMGRKLGGLCPLCGGRGSPSNTIARVEANLRTNWQLHPSSRLATMDIGRKLGAVRGLPPYEVVY